MKLIFCGECCDIVALRSWPRACGCGRSYGRYVDDLNAVYGGEAVPLGISNPSFAKALHRQPAEGLGCRFEAFVIPSTCDTMRKIDATEWTTKHA